MDGNGRSKIQQKIKRGTDSRERKEKKTNWRVTTSGLYSGKKKKEMWKRDVLV